MKNLMKGKIQIFNKFLDNWNRQIYGLGIVLCLCAYFNLEVRGQSNQKSKSKSDPTTQTKTVNPNLFPENQRPVNQTKIGKIMIKEDAFANKKTTVLPEHSLSPTLTVNMKCVIDKKTNRTAMERYLDFATVEFISTSGKVEYIHASEVNFLVDGKSVRGNQVSSFLSSRQPGVETVITTLGFDVLSKISQGKELKMKLGENIFVLDNELKKLVKEFIDVAQ